MGLNLQRNYIHNSDSLVTGRDGRRRAPSTFRSFVRRAREGRGRKEYVRTSISSMLRKTCSARVRVSFDKMIYFFSNYRCTEGWTLLRIKLPKKNEVKYRIIWSTFANRPIDFQLWITKIEPYLWYPFQFSRISYPFSRSCWVVQGQYVEIRKRIDRKKFT